MVLLGLVVMGASCSLYPQEKMDERKVISSGQFRLRLSRFAVNSAAVMAGYRYVIEVASTDADSWKQVHVWVQDEPWEVDDFEMIAIAPEIGYFFNRREFAVTMDAGQTWTYFNYYKVARADGVDTKFGREISKVDIDADGSGRIYMRDYSDRKSEIRVLYKTSDFGRTWTLIQRNRI